jgi:hypothetical protein
VNAGDIVSERDCLMWHCKNCALDWPENFCGVCGCAMTATDLCYPVQAGGRASSPENKGGISNHGR